MLKGSHPDVRTRHVSKPRVKRRTLSIPPTSVSAAAVPPGRIVPRGYARLCEVYRGRPGLLRRPVFGRPWQPPSMACLRPPTPARYAVRRGSPASAPPFRAPPTGPRPQPVPLRRSQPAPRGCRFRRATPRVTPAHRLHALRSVAGGRDGRPGSRHSDTGLTRGRMPPPRSPTKPRSTEPAALSSPAGLPDTSHQPSSRAAALHSRMAMRED